MRADGDGLVAWSATSSQERAGFHDLRHTFASLALGADFIAFEVSRWMGCASTPTTTDVHGHLVPTDCSAQIDRLEAAVARG